MEEEVLVTGATTEAGAEVGEALGLLMKINKTKTILETIKIIEDLKEQEVMTEGAGGEALVPKERRLWLNLDRLTSQNQDGEGEEEVPGEEEDSKTLQEEGDLRTIKEGEVSIIVREEGEEDSRPVKEGEEVDLILVVEEEEEEEDLSSVKEKDDLKTVKIEKKSIGLRWKHSTTTSMRQTTGRKEEASMLTGADMKTTSEEAALITAMAVDGEEARATTAWRVRPHLVGEAEAEEVTTCRPQPRIRRLGPRVSRRPGRATGRVLTPGVGITTSPGGQSARSAAHPSRGRTTPTQPQTYQR